MADCQFFVHRGGHWLEKEGAKEAEEQRIRDKSLSLDSETKALSLVQRKYDMRSRLGDVVLCYPPEKGWDKEHNRWKLASMANQVFYRVRVEGLSLEEAKTYIEPGIDQKHRFYIDLTKLPAQAQSDLSVSGQTVITKADWEKVVLDKDFLRVG